MLNHKIYITITVTITVTLLIFTNIIQAAKLAIVIDDFGYHPILENQVLKMPIGISIAILPDAPFARKMAAQAHQQGREILIHLPMAPLSQQPLERNTLSPAMSHDEIARIIREAVDKVPHAVGLNNHMGSAMTSSLSDMQKFMQVLSKYNFYFLDSMTISNSQSLLATAGTSIKVIKRNIFLDNTQEETNINYQFNLAIALARRNGFAIAIGHPYPTTIRTLQKVLLSLPEDIVLVRPSLLFNDKLETMIAVHPASKSIIPIMPHFWRRLIYYLLTTALEKESNNIFDIPNI